jgi:glutaredoxin
MKPRFILAAMLAAAMNGALAGDLYRWVDQSGKVHYGDAPPADAARAVQKKFADSETPEAALPYETRRARENFPVTLYVADNCKEPCRQARDLLNGRGIPFTEKNLASREDIDAFRKMSGEETVPVLVVGSNRLIRFQAEQWNGELDFAGYPRSAPYGFRPAPPPPAQTPTVQPAPVQPAEPAPQAGE